MLLIKNIRRRQNMAKEKPKKDRGAAALFIPAGMFAGLVLGFLLFAIAVVMKK